jgi:FkbM family methyltransferase
MAPWIQAIAGKIPVTWIKRISALQFTSPAFRAVLNVGSRAFRHRDLTIRKGIGRGLRFNTGDSNIGYVLGTTEMDVQQLLAQHVAKGSVVYDVGAHIGFFTVLGAGLVGPSGRVVAFEPLPANITQLRHNIAINAFQHVQVVEAAVAESAGRAELQLVGNSTGPKLASAGRHPDAKGSIDVETLALDKWLAESGERPPNFVKIDVEGAEIEVIRGMRDILERYRPVILCEMHGRNQEYVTLISSLGYDARCLNETTPVEDAYWNVHTIAIPRAEASTALP